MEEQRWLEEITFDILNNKIEPKIATIKAELHKQRIIKRLQSGEQGSFITVKNHTDSDLILDVLAATTPSFQKLTLNFQTHPPAKLKRQLTIVPNRNTTVTNQIHIKGSSDLMGPLREMFSSVRRDDLYLEVINAEEVKISDLSQSGDWWPVLKELTHEIDQLKILF